MKEFIIEIREFVFNEYLGDYEDIHIESYGEDAENLEALLKKWQPEAKGKRYLSIDEVSYTEVFNGKDCVKLD